MTGPIAHVLLTWASSLESVRIKLHLLLETGALIAELRRWPLVEVAWILLKILGLSVMFNGMHLLSLILWSAWLRRPMLCIGISTVPLLIEI